MFGHGVYPAAAMFNHSCDPNCMVEPHPDGIWTMQVTAPLPFRRPFTTFRCLSPSYHHHLSLPFTAALTTFRCLSPPFHHISLPFTVAPSCPADQDARACPGGRRALHQLHRYERPVRRATGKAAQAVQLRLRLRPLHGRARRRRVHEDLNRPAVAAELQCRPGPARRGGAEADQEGAARAARGAAAPAAAAAVQRRRGGER